MNDITLHSKLIDLQGQTIQTSEGESMLSQLRGILLLLASGQISKREAGARIRKSAWRIAEDLRINGVDLSTGSDEELIENLPGLLKA